MSVDHTGPVLGAVLLALLALICARESESQTLDELLAGLAECPQLDCPRPRPPREWEVRVSLPESAAPGDVYELRVSPGWSPSRVAACGRLRGRTVRGEQVSEWSEIGTPGDCVALPEPGLGVGIAVGVAGLVWTLRRRR